MSDIIDHAKNASEAAKSMTEAYQAKLLEITNENIEFAMELGEALAAVRSPSDFMNVTTEYAKKRMELFQRHTQELLALSGQVVNSG
jgi:hypothetical protein